MEEEAVHEQIEADLSRNRTSLQYLDRRADDFTDRAFHLRQLANEIGVELFPLRTAFDQIRRLHTRNTWQGQAATISRQRLDTHEERHNTALRHLDQLIDDLEREASISQQQATDIHAQMSSVRWAISQLEQELAAV